MRASSWYKLLTIMFSINVLLITATFSYVLIIQQLSEKDLIIGSIVAGIITAGQGFMASLNYRNYKQSKQKEVVK